MNGQLGLVVTWTLSLATALVSSISFSVSWPPETRPEWIWAAALVVATLATGLWASRRDSNRGRRAIASFSMLLALGSSLVPLFAYYGSYNDLPWIPVWIALGLVGIGGWFARQRALACLILTVALLALCGTDLPPRSGGSWSAHSGDLTVTLSPPSPYSTDWELTATAPPGKNLYRTYDLDHVVIEGKIGPILPVHAWPGFLSPIERNLSGPNVSHIQVRVFVPRWTRSWDATVFVPRWPTPAATLVVPLAVADHGIASRFVSTGSGPIKGEVSNVQWALSKNRLPPERCLHLTLTYSGYPYSGTRGYEFRIRDDKDRLLEPTPSEVNGDPEGASLHVEIFGISKSAKSLTVDLFSEAARQANVQVFRFSRLPSGYED